MKECASKAYTFGLKNLAPHFCYHATSRYGARPANDEFVGMAAYASELVFELHAERSVLGSSGGSPTLRGNATWHAPQKATWKTSGLLAISHVTTCHRAPQW